MKGLHDIVLRPEQGARELLDCALVRIAEEDARGPVNRRRKKLLAQSGAAGLTAEERGTRPASGGRRSACAAALHRERLHRLQPFDAAVRTRLLAALRQTPDSPARSRLAAFDLARRAAALGRLAVPLGPLSSVPALSTAWPPVPPLAPAVPQPASKQPTRMPYAD